MDVNYVRVIPTAQGRSRSDLAGKIARRLRRLSESAESRSRDSTLRSRYPQSRRKSQLSNGAETRNAGIAEVSEISRHLHGLGCSRNKAARRKPVMLTPPEA